MKKIDLECSLLKFDSLSKSNMTIELRRNVCALRNSGGGLIRIKNSDGKQINFRHFHSHFDSVLWKLKSIYSAETFVSVYSFDVEESEGSQYLLIKVSASNFIVTENFKTYYMFDCGVIGEEAVTERQIESVWIQKQLAHLHKPSPKQRITTILTDGKPIDLDEATDIQFKGAENCCFAENFVKSHMKDSHYFRKYVSSFAKNSNGGSVFYGVTEEVMKKGSPKCAVARGIGCNLSEIIDRDRIKSAIEDIVYSYKWVRCDRHLLTWKEIKQYFTTTFHMLDNTTDEKYVLEVSVSKFCGLVFTSGGPSSSVFSELNAHEPQLVNEHVLGWVSRIEKDIKKNREKYDKDVSARTCISGGDHRYILYYKSNIFDKEEYKNESSKSSILSTVCALRNSGGGELNLQNFNRKCHDVDMWHKYHDHLLWKLTSAFNAECYADVFHFKMFDDKKGIKLTVASSNNWITRRFNTSFSCDFALLSEEIITEKQIEYCLIEPTQETTSSNHISDLSLLNDSRFSRCENIFAFKNHDNINIEAFLEYMREQLPMTRKYVSAFNKVDDGGSIYYGIDADKNTRLGTKATEKKTNVCGLPLDLDNDDMLKIEDMIMWSLVKECTWMRQDGSCLDDKTEKEVAEYVRVIFHRIPPFSDILHRYVLEIRVRRFYGLMFHSKSGPESYYVYHGNVVELSKQNQFEAKQSLQICGQSVLRFPLRKWYSKLMEKIMSTGMQQISSPVLHKKSEKDLNMFSSFQDLYMRKP